MLVREDGVWLNFEYGYAVFEMVIGSEWKRRWYCIGGWRDDDVM